MTLNDIAAAIAADATRLNADTNAQIEVEKLLVTLRRLGDKLDGHTKGFRALQSDYAEMGARCDVLLAGAK